MPFSSGSPGVPDGENLGQSLGQLPDGAYYINVSAFSEATAPGRVGLECNASNPSENLHFRKQGDTLTFFTP